MLAIKAITGNLLSTPMTGSFHGRFSSPDWLVLYSFYPTLSHIQHGWQDNVVFTCNSENHTEMSVWARSLSFCISIGYTNLHYKVKLDLSWHILLCFFQHCDKPSLHSTGHRKESLLGFLHSMWKALKIINHLSSWNLTNPSLLYPCLVVSMPCYWNIWFPWLIIPPKCKSLKETHTRHTKFSDQNVENNCCYLNVCISQLSVYCIFLCCHVSAVVLL